MIELNVNIAVGNLLLFLHRGIFLYVPKKLKTSKLKVGSQLSIPNLNRQQILTVGKL